MDIFTKSKSVIRLRSYHDKYLVADDDRKTVRQSRNGSSKKARWHVEFLKTEPDSIRLRSCHGRYLAATSSSFLLGMTGNKVIQTDTLDFVDWKPIRDGFSVKLQSAARGTLLRGNGGPPPWKNSVTHDNPLNKLDWSLWQLEEVDVGEDQELNSDCLSLVSSVSFSSLSDDGADLGSPVSVQSLYSQQSMIRKTGMDLFHNAKAVRFRSHHGKYLLADEDQDSVSQDRGGSSKRARWYVELVSGSDNVIRLKSCYGRYLTASNQPFLLGMTGCKVLQTLPSRLDSSLEWEPIREGDRIKIRTRYGHFLRGNGGVPPWRNSITHDIPHRSTTKDWILWDVHVVEILEQSSTGNPSPPVSDTVPFESSSPSTCSTKSQSFGRQESSDSLAYSPPKADGGRTIYYAVADDNGNVEENEGEGLYISFKGNGVDALTRTLEEETGLEGIIVCTKSSLNGNLYPLRLQLPPNNTTMNVIVVPSSSKLARGFAKPGIQ